MVGVFSACEGDIEAKSSTKEQTLSSNTETTEPDDTNPPDTTEKTTSDELKKMTTKFSIIPM